MADTAALPVSVLPTAANGKAIYTLTYRIKQHPAPLTKHFVYETLAAKDMYKLVERCKVHCDRTNIVFIRVSPFLSDLSDDEKRMSDFG